MRVLLVESSSRIAAALAADLQADAIRVELAANGEDALHVMRDCGFDLVLVNLQLSDMDGSSLITRIRSARHDTPVIALSAVPQPRLRALAVGADDGIDRAELIAVSAPSSAAAAASASLF